MKLTKFVFCLIFAMLWACTALAQDGNSNDTGDTQGQGEAQIDANVALANSDNAAQVQAQTVDGASNGGEETSDTVSQASGIPQAQSNGADNSRNTAGEAQKTGDLAHSEDKNALVVEPETQETIDNSLVRNSNYIGWNTGFKFYFGLGPALDMKEIEFGYSARLGLDVHINYFGIGLEVTWYMIWGTNAQKVSELFSKAYRKTNSSFILILNGYIPVNDNFLFSLGGGAGLGRRYVTVYADDKVRDSGVSWLARAQVGFVWRCDNDLFIAIDFAFDFGNFLIKSKHPSLIGLGTDNAFGLALGLGYQAVFSHEKHESSSSSGSWWHDDD